MTVFAKQFIWFVSQGYEYALIKLNKILVCCHLFNKKLGLYVISAKLFLNSILSSRYYLAVRLTTNSKHVSFISNWFTLAAEYIWIKSATIYLFKLITSFSDFFGKGKEIEKKLHSIVIIQHNGNGFEYCQYVLNCFLNNFNWLTLDTN